MSPFLHRGIASLYEIGMFLPNTESQEKLPRLFFFTFIFFLYGMPECRPGTARRKLSSPSSCFVGVIHVFHRKRCSPLNRRMISLLPIRARGRSNTSVSVSSFG